MTESTVHEILREMQPPERDTFGGLTLGPDTTRGSVEDQWFHIRAHFLARQFTGKFEQHAGAGHRRPVD